MYKLKRVYIIMKLTKITDIKSEIKKEVENKIVQESIIVLKICARLLLKDKNIVFFSSTEQNAQVSYRYQPPSVVCKLFL